MKNQTNYDRHIVSKNKLLSRLSQTNNFIQRQKPNLQNTTSSKHEWGLWKLGNNGKPSLIEIIDDQLMFEFFSEGILKDDGLLAPLTKAGRICIKRTLSNGNQIIGQHQERQNKVISIAGMNKSVSTDISESPLAWLATRKDKQGKPMIDEFQFASGERLRASYEKGLMSPRITRDWDRLSLSSSRQKSSSFDGLSLSDAVITARQNFSLALEAVGPELNGVLYDICCEQRGLEDAEKRRGWPKRSGKIILRMALTRLARHYGLISDGNSDNMRARGIKHWGADDFRPVIDG